MCVTKKKNNIQGRLPKKGVLGQFADLRVSLVKKRGWCLCSHGGVLLLVRSTVCLKLKVGQISSRYLYIS